MIVQFLFKAISRCACDNKGAPSDALIVIVADVVPDLSTKLVNTSSSASVVIIPSLIDVVRANIISHLSNDLQADVNEGLKSIPENIVIALVDNAGIFFKLKQLENIENIFVTEDVSNNGTVCNELQF